MGVKATFIRLTATFNTELLSFANIEAKVTGFLF